MPECDTVECHGACPDGTLRFKLSCPLPDWPDCGSMTDNHFPHMTEGCLSYEANAGLTYVGTTELGVPCPTRNGE